MNVFYTLLFIHICFGAISLLSAAGALFATKGQWWHRHFGEFFFYGMSGVFVTAIPMSLMKSNVFLFTIAIFSYYLAFSGWRFYDTNSTYAIILWVFGALGARLSYGNLKIFQRGGARGKERLVQHFSSMIGATIAAVTAFVVTNIHIQPVIILWLGPTIVLVPVIFWWRRKIYVEKWVC